MHFELKDYDTSSWRLFKINKILTRIKIKSISSVVRTFNNGSINVVGNSTINNGIIKKLDIQDIKYIHEGNTLSYGAKGGLFFWQDKQWASTDHVHMFVNKKLNKYSALFLCSILNKLISIKGGWSSSLESNIIYETIKLPIDHNGDPDWEYMENEIKNIYSWFYKEYFQEFDNFKNSNVILSNWRIFKIKDLFEVSRGKRIVKNRDYVENKDDDNVYPVVTAKTLNNAIDGYYSKYNCDGNVITSCGEVSGMISFYQEDKCWVLDTVRILKPKFNNLNKYIALFLIPILNKWNCLFSYARKAKPSDINELTIKLPVDCNGDPDWEYMENYIKSLPYSKYI